jgi:hypothetical protein
MRYLLITTVFISLILFGQKDSYTQQIIRTIDSLIGKSYKSGTLEINESESLVTNMNEFDCVTFVETVTALSVCGENRENYSVCFTNELKKMRYKNGKIDGYTSRLHFFSSWIIQNGRGLYYNDITKKLGGEPLNRNVNLMSSNRELYPKLNDKNLIEIKKYESELSNTTFYYIPKNKIKDIERKIPNGSLIAFVSKNETIIIAHTGFSYNKANKVTLAHASSDNKKAVITSNSLFEYTKSVDSFVGIIILEPSYKKPSS